MGYDHAARITMKEALEHPYFDPIRQREHSEFVTVSFQPGPLGIAAQPSGFVTRVDREGQGGCNGVMVGWRLDSIDHQIFSIQSLREIACGQRPYTLTFQRAKESQ